IERVHETKPPEVEIPILKPWIEIKNSPDQPPVLRETTDGASLIAAGTHVEVMEEKKDVKNPNKKPQIAVNATVVLKEYGESESVYQSLKAYMDTAWKPWSEQERLRRKTIRLYSELFTLQQQLEGSIVESALELAWGVGIGVWHKDGANIS